LTSSHFPYTTLFRSGELVRIVVDPLPRDSAELQELTGPFHRFGLRGAFVQDDWFGDLASDPPDRVEGVHRPLKDDGNTLPANPPDRKSTRLNSSHVA